MKDRQARRLAAASVIFIYTLVNTHCADAGAAGFRVRKPNGDTLPGAVSFTPRAPSGKASSIINLAKTSSEDGRLVSMFPRYAQSEVYDMLREGTPGHAVTLRGYVAFKVTGYAKSVGSVVMRVEVGAAVSSAYRYAAALAVIYPDGSVDWHTMAAKVYSSETLAVTLGSALCAALSKEGRTGVMLIIGESYRWW
ncbi:MAG: hypothetical protein LBS11_05035 [Oscillospiraceae bacterium]|jgi:hypothetical protein|nr:hypothetical protein [Oscillospiraceae bacterium]